MMLHAGTPAGLSSRTLSQQGSGPTATLAAPLVRTFSPAVYAPVPDAHGCNAMRMPARLPVRCGRPQLQPVCAVAAAAPVQPSQAAATRPMKVLIAGAGIGGLVLAVALIKQGFEVHVFERDLTAIRGEGKYRGPIQVQSNALAALEAIDEDVAEEVLREGCITGDRINGLCDGLTGEWYIKFDTFHPAVSKGLPVTRVISRVTLQAILARAVEKYGGSGIVENGCAVQSFEERVNAGTGAEEVVITMDDGRTITGDVLIGCDGIWSKIRKQLIGETKANYSGYTCYTGISDFTPADIDIVGYRVFLGNGQYFVSSDVGNGKMQWYGFHKEPSGGSDAEGTRKARLLQIFGHWNDNVVDLIKATPEEDVLRRDIFDRPPIFSWAKGRVALLGDSAHAMQPNLGQGGCMAIEDAYELAQRLAGAVADQGGVPAAVDVEAVLKAYQNQRMMRVSAIHGMAGMAAFMASTYKCYLGEGWSKWVENLRIPHPGRVIGRLVMLLTMPMVLDWVLGGNTEHVAANRTSKCRLGDKPKAFGESQFGLFMSNDEAIVRSSHADWLLVSERSAAASDVGSADACSTAQLKGIYIEETAMTVGRSAASQAAAASTSASAAASVDLLVDDMHAAEQHARVWRDAEGGHWLKDLGGRSGTWVNGRQLASGSTVQLWPGDAVEFGRHPSHEVFKVKMQHVTLRSNELSGHQYNTLMVGKPMGTGEQQQQQGEAGQPLQHALAQGLATFAGKGKGQGNLVTA